MFDSDSSSGNQVASVRRHPTVVVARRVKSGHEHEFEKWQRRLTAVAKTAPGHMGVEIQSPNLQHPGEWVVIYQFADREKLDQWLESPERRSILAQGQHLIEGQPRQQVIALANHDSPVTGIASFRLTDEGFDKFDELNLRLLEAMSAFPGFLRSERFEAIQGEQDETIVTFSFASREQLDAWLNSDVRRSLLAELEPFLQTARTVNVVGGFAGWFDRPDEPAVKRWKQASLVLMGLYPTALVLTILRTSLLPDLGLAFNVLLANIAGVALLTWIVMPLLTRVFDGWLRR